MLSLGFRFQGYVRFGFKGLLTREGGESSLIVYTNKVGSRVELVKPGR